jgi:hypothetical protein
LANRLYGAEVTDLNGDRGSAEITITVDGLVKNYASCARSTA